jgi:hypothetical protein
MSAAFALLFFRMTPPKSAPFFGEFVQIFDLVVGQIVVFGITQSTPGFHS